MLVIDNFAIKLRKFIITCSFILLYSSAKATKLSILIFFFLICFLALFIYRLLEKKLERKYTCEELLSTLRDYEFADVQGQGFIPIYESTKLTDALHEVAGFETDYEFLTKRKMKEIQKLSKQSREKS